MKRMFLVLALAATVSMAGTTMAQGPGGPGGFKKKRDAPAAEDDGVKKLESELNKLRAQLRELEQLVNNAKAAAAKEGQGKTRGGSGDSPEKKEGKRPGGSFEKKEGKRPGGDFEKKEGSERGGPGDSPEKKEGKRPGGDFEKKEGNKAGGDFERKEPKDFGPEGGFEKKDRKGFGPRGSFEKKGRKGFGPGGNFEKKDRKGFGPPPGEPGRPASVDERLDRILHELEDIRRELKQ